MTELVGVVYNGCFGGFGLTDKQLELGRELSGNPEWRKDGRFSDENRDDPILVKVVEKDLEDERFSDLEVRYIPKGSEYRIDEYDGNESVMLKDEYDWSIA